VIAAIPSKYLAKTPTSEPVQGKGSKLIGDISDFVDSSGGMAAILGVISASVALAGKAAPLGKMAGGASSNYELLGLAQTIASLFSWDSKKNASKLVPEKLRDVSFTVAGIGSIPLLIQSLSIGFKNISPVVGQVVAGAVGVGSIFNAITCIQTISSQKTWSHKCGLATLELIGSLASVAFRVSILFLAISTTTLLWIGLGFATLSLVNAVYAAKIKEKGKAVTQAEFVAGSANNMSLVGKVIAETSKFFAAIAPISAAVSWFKAIGAHADLFGKTKAPFKLINSANDWGNSKKRTKNLDGNLKTGATVAKTCASVMDAASFLSATKLVDLGKVMSESIGALPIFALVAATFNTLGTFLEIISDCKKCHAAKKERKELLGDLDKELEGRVTKLTGQMIKNADSTITGTRWSIASKVMKLAAIIFGSIAVALGASSVMLIAGLAAFGAIGTVVAIKSILYTEYNKPQNIALLAA
jgi:hypothetical protein